MRGKRIGAAGAALAGGIAFVVLAVFLDRVSDQAAQWMQAGGTVLAFFGLLFVHWNDGKRKLRERTEHAALAADLIRREMKSIGSSAEVFLDLCAGLYGSEFLNFLDSFRDSLKHPRSDKFLQTLAAAHFSAARNAAFAVDVLDEIWRYRNRFEAAEADDLEAKSEFEFREFATKNMRRVANAAKRATNLLPDVEEKS